MRYHDGSFNARALNAFTEIGSWKRARRKPTLSFYALHSNPQPTRKRIYLTETAKRTKLTCNFPNNKQKPSLLLFSVTSNLIPW